jgi:hypothetical protein
MSKKESCPSLVVGNTTDDVRTRSVKILRQMASDTELKQILCGEHGICSRSEGPMVRLHLPSYSHPSQMSARLSIILAWDTCYTDKNSAGCIEFEDVVGQLED